jgi:hypothetical protein
VEEDQHEQKDQAVRRVRPRPSEERSKASLDVLWKIAQAAKGDFSMTVFESASYSARFERLEQELYSLMLPPGSKAVLQDGIEYVRSK